jgi:hypothetical protein
MNSTEFSRRFFLSELGSPEAAALARDMVEDARYPAHLALKQYLSSADHADRTKAMNVLADLQELSIVPLAESAPMPDLDIEVWVLRTMADELMEFRRRAATVLKDLLANRHPAAPPTEGTPYQAPPGARVCDLAFILLHRMLRLEFSPAAFLGVPSGDRDTRIQDFRESRVFRSAFESKS